MLVESSIIAPHGGHLVDRRAPDENRKELVGETLGLPRVHLDARTLSDLQMIASGVFSPLEGFMLRKDYESVVEDMRLSSGPAWTIPVTLSVEEENARSLREDSVVALVDDSGEPVATMFLRERYRYDKEREAQEVYRTTDPATTPRPRRLPQALPRTSRTEEALRRKGLEEGGRLPDEKPRP
jgi:sulfate adenylyltransferase